MSKDSIINKTQKQIERKTKKDLEELKNTSDPIKQIQISYRIRKKSYETFVNSILKASSKDFHKFMEEFSNPIEEQFTNLLSQEKNVAFKNAENPEQFEQFKKIQKLEQKLNTELVDSLNQYDLDIEGFQRLFTFFVTVIGKIEMDNRLLNLQLNEMLQALIIINRRFGFDINWLIGMALIQFHENLLKGKLSELGEKIHKDEKMPSIISRLVQSVRIKEKRDIKLSLEMSAGLKNIRNLLTHEGYKHSVSKSDLGLILEEIKKLEKILYP